MTETRTTEKIPNPIYAAAGVGDLAYQQLRKLPARVAELRERVAANELDLRVDVDKLRSSARRNADAFKTGAQTAQERATALYTDLVARGQQVVRNGRPTHEVPGSAIGATPAHPVDDTPTKPLAASVHKPAKAPKRDAK